MCTGHILKTCCLGGFLDEFATTSKCWHSIILSIFYEQGRKNKSKALFGQDYTLTSSIIN